MKNTDSLDEFERFIEKVLKNYCFYSFLVSQRQWPLDAVAVELETTVEKLGQWVSRKRAMLNKLMESEREKTWKLREQFEKDYPKESYTWPDCKKYIDEKIVERKG